MNLTEPIAPFTRPSTAKSDTRKTVEEVIKDYSKRGGIAPSRIAEILGLDVGSVRRYTNPLRDSGWAVNVGTRNAPLYVRATDVQTKAAEPVRHVPRGNYDPIELRAFDGRPGSMDAYKLPSMVDGVRVPYNGIRPQLVGALKDSSNNAR